MPTVSNPSQDEVRYFRRASPEACAFCRLLAIRPYAQYDSEESALNAHHEEGNPYHGNCDCEAIALSPFETYPLPAYTEQWIADYSAARDELDEPGNVASEADILNHMRRAQYARDHEEEEEPELRAAGFGGDVTLKFNPHHDPHSGQFSGDGGSGGGAAPQRGSGKHQPRVGDTVSFRSPGGRVAAGTVESVDPGGRSGTVNFGGVQTGGAAGRYRGRQQMDLTSAQYSREADEEARAQGFSRTTGTYEQLGPHPDNEPEPAPKRPRARKATDMDVVTKSVDAQVRPVESDNPNGEFEVVLSTERLDRDGENLWADEWRQPLPPRIHIDSDHGMSIEKTVGSAVPRLEGNQMVGAGTYASTPHAQMVRQLVNEGHITSLSVTYAEKKNQKDGKPQRELLNAAFVAVPANPDAVVLSSKAAKDSDGKKPYGDVAYADPGYQKDNRKRYPIDTAAHVRSAWSYVNQESNASQYSAEDLKKVKDRIRAAAGKFGVEIAEDKKSLEILVALEAVRKQFGASGNNPVRPGDMIQAIHDASVALGSQCTNMTQADTGEDEGANKALDEYHSKSSSLVEVGSPQESAVQSAATDTTAHKAAVSAAADESADDVATQTVGVRARSLAFLTTRHTEKE